MVSAHTDPIFVIFDLRICVCVWLICDVFCGFQALPNQGTVDYPSFKLVIVGDGGTGEFLAVPCHDCLLETVEYNVLGSYVQLVSTRSEGSQLLMLWNLSCYGAPRL